LTGCTEEFGLINYIDYSESGLPMPCAYHINLEEELVTVTGSLQVTLPDAVELGTRLLNDPEFSSALPHLVDLRGLEMRRSTEESAQFKAFVLNQYRKSVKGLVAVVVDESLDGKALAALYHLMSRVRGGELFDNYEHALRWLMRNEFAATASLKNLRR
jgi:hypothetical protein